MNDPATSLDRLHDIVVPPPVPLWPPAPGWYAVLAIAACCLAAAGYQVWKHWRAGAYRREALRELGSADSAAKISELLRRVALVIAPRDEVASQTGNQWPQWLVAHCPEKMSEDVRDQLTVGIYQPQQGPDDLHALRDYAASWIHRHIAATTDS